MKDKLDLMQTSFLISLRNDISRELEKRERYCRAKKRERLVSSIKPVEQKSSSKNQLFKHNSSSLLALPNHKSRKLQSNSVYLHALLSQNWSHLFNKCDTTPKYYVYAHVDPSKSIFIAPKVAGGNYGGTPFYIGKGCGGRAYNLKRNQGHGKIIKELLSRDFSKESIVQILFDGLTEAKALEIEAKLIYFFGSIYTKTIKKKGVLLNLEMPTSPAFNGVMIEKADCLPEKHTNEVGD